MESQPVSGGLISNGNKRSRNKKNKSKNVKGVEDRKISTGREGGLGAPADASIVAATHINGDKVDHDGSSHEDDNNDSRTNTNITSLQQDLEKERQKSQELERKMEKLVLSANAAEEVTWKLNSQNSRVEELEEEMKSLQNELNSVRKSSPGTKSLDLEMQRLRTGLEDEREGRRKDQAENDRRIKEILEQKEDIDKKYANLLGRVSTIRATLGERMKADAEDLAQTKQQLEELEEQNNSLNDIIDDVRGENFKLREEKDAANKELSAVRNRLNLAQQNWNQEKDELINAERYTKEDYEAARQAMQDWEVIAMEERSVRESLSGRVVELEELLVSQKTAYDQISSEYEKQESTMSGLQRALQEIQEARKKELREIVENTQAQTDTLSARCQTLESQAKIAASNLEITKRDLERVLPFEKEVKEKNLLIGKLRHEAVTLNDHLRKALRMLKRDNADDKIDKELVTNVFLQFISIQRGDTKKYEVLQLIASVLDWGDEQREKAGLLRPGTTVNGGSSSNTFMPNFKASPLTSFHRSPSTPTLGDAYGGDKELWTSVLGDSDK